MVQCRVTTHEIPDHGLGGKRLLRNALSILVMGNCVVLVIWLSSSLFVPGDVSSVASALTPGSFGLSCSAGASAISRSTISIVLR